MKGMFSPKTTPIPYRPVLFGIIAILLWCWSGICFRKGAQALGSSMVYLTFMTGVGALTAIAFQYFRGRQVADMIRLPFKVIVSGFFGVALYTVMLAAAFGMADEADIGQINLLNYLWPVWMVILGILLLHSRPKILLSITGILFGLTGVIISRGLGMLLHLPDNLTPHFLSLAGGFLWALYAVLLRRWKIPEEKAGTAIHFAVCAAIAGLMAFFNNDWQQIPPISFQMVWWVMLGGIGPVGIAYSLYEISVKNGPVILIASLSYFIPVGSSVLIGLFFKEAMNSGLFAGAFLISGGAWLVRRSIEVESG